MSDSHWRVDSNSCGAVAEDSEKTAQWAVFSSAACVIHPRPPKKSSVVITLDFCFTSNLEFHYLGWIRTAAEPTAACGGNREARLGPRPAGCERQRSRRWEPQPGFLIISAACVIHPARLGNRTALHRPPAHNRRNAFYSCISRMTPYEKAPPPRRTSEAGALPCYAVMGRICGQAQFFRP